MYDELELEEQQATSNVSQADKNTISGKKLEERLVLTGGFRGDEAAIMLENMVKAGRLK
jgi:hypothetical protein